MIIVKNDNSQPGDPGQKVVTIYVPKNYNVTGTLQLVVKDRATDEEIVFDNPGDNAFPGSSYHILTIDVGRLEPSTEYEYTLIHKDNTLPAGAFRSEDAEKIIGRGLLRTE